MNEKLLDLKKLRSFITVSDTYSFVRAAELLHYSSASLTIQIQSLEKELGVTLFDRLGKRIYLTNEGVQLYEYATELLRLNADAMNAFHEDTTPQGHLRIGTIASLSSNLFPPLMQEFHAKYPKITISLVTDTPSILYKKLSYNDLDLLVVLDEPLAREDMNTIMRVPISVVPCVHQNHPLANTIPISLEKLLSYPCILTEQDASYRRLFDQQLASFNKHISPIFESDNVDFIISMLQDSRFFSVLPSTLFDGNKNSCTLVPLKVDGLNLSIQLQIFCSKHKYISRDIKAFLTTAKAYLYHAFSCNSPVI